MFWSFLESGNPFLRTQLKRGTLHKAEVEGSDMTFDLREGSAKLCGLVHGQMFRGEFINNY